MMVAASAVSVAGELAKGGAYTLAFICVVEAGVIGFLFRELVKSYKENNKEIEDALGSVTKTQVEHTMSLNTMLDMLKTLQQVFIGGKG